MNNIGGNIRLIRGIKKLTQKGLADLTGFSQRHISRLENGQSPINEKRLNRLAKALNVPVEKIKNLDISSFLK